MGGRLFDWLGAGVSGSRPAAASMPALLVSPGSVAFYYATDTQILGVFDESGPAWFDIDVASLAAVAFATLPDVDLTGIADGDVFQWDAAGSLVKKLTLPTLLFNTLEQIQDAVGAMVANGTGTTGSYDDTAGTFKFDSLITQYTDEMAQDALAAAFAAGTHTGFTVNYTDGSNKFDFVVTVTQYTDEMAQDAFAALIAAGTDTGLTLTYNDAGNAESITIIQASDVEVWTGTATNRVVTPKSLWDSQVPVTVADAVTITLDGNTGLNFKTTLAGNRTIANPTNMKPGQSGVYHLTQDATGSRVATWGSNFRFAGGAAVGGVLSTAANAVDCLSYFVRADGTITCSLMKDIKA